MMIWRSSSTRADSSTISVEHKGRYGLFLNCSSDPQDYTQATVERLALLRQPRTPCNVSQPPPRVVQRCRPNTRYVLEHLSDSSHAFGLVINKKLSGAATLNDYGNIPIYFHRARVPACYMGPQQVLRLRPVF